MVTDAADAARSSVVRWQGETDGRLRTAFRHVVAATLLTVVVALVSLLVLVSFVSLRRGATDTVVLVVVMALVGGPFSLLYIVAIRGKTSFSDLLPYELNLRPRYVLAGVPVALGILTTVVLFPPLFYGYLLGAPLAWGVIAARDGGGELDVEAGTLTLRPGTAASVERGPKDVRALERHSSWRVGGFRLVRLRYRGSLSLTKPTLFVVPEADYPAVDAALAAVERGDYDIDVSETSLAAKAFLVGFGLLFVGIAAALALFAADSSPRVLMPASLMACFGLGFVLLAWVA